MMGEFGSDDKNVSKHIQTQKPRLKRSYAMFRECEAGINGGYSGGHVVKKMKESNHETIQHLTEYKPTTDNRQHEMRSDGRSVKKKFNHYGTTKHSDSPLNNRVVPSAHMGVRRSARMLKLPSTPSSSSSLESEVVRDGPRKEAKKKLSITPENYQDEAERIKSFDGWPLNRTVYPEQLARVGFVYTGEGALVQCFQCGFGYCLWNEQDVPLNVHQICSPLCPFLQTLTNEGKSSSTEQRPPQSYIQPELNSGLQFPYHSDQVMRTRLKPFLQFSGTQQPVYRHLVRQNWEGSDNDEDYMNSPNHSLMASEQICVAKLESGNTSRVPIQSIHHSHHSGRLEDNSNKCFKSPTQSLSGSLKTPQSSERLAVEGGLQETASNSLSSNTIYHSANYYNMEGAEQRFIGSDAVVTGIHTGSATVLRQDPLSLSSQASADPQSDILVHSLDSEQISSGRTAIHSGDGIETTIPGTSSSPNLRQNQLPSSSDTILPPGNSITSPDDGNHASETSYASGWGQSPSLSSQGVSRNITDSDDESFYSAESHGTSYSTSTPLDPAKTNVMYEERSLSEGLKNQYVPDVL